MTLYGAGYTMAVASLGNGVSVMIEVTARLRFTHKCLGSVKEKRANNDVVFKMPRAPDGRVMFLPSWWNTGVKRAAKLLNRHQTLVKKIEWDPCIEGRPNGKLNRDVRPKGKPWWVAVHEIFDAGAEIGVNAILPDGLSIDDFWQILEIVGTYRGVSPFQLDGRQYGTFEVVGLQRRNRMPPAERVPDEATEGIEAKK